MGWSRQLTTVSRGGRPNLGVCQRHASPGSGTICLVDPVWITNGCLMIHHVAGVLILDPCRSCSRTWNELQIDAIASVGRRVNLDLRTRNKAVVCPDCGMSFIESTVVTCVGRPTPRSPAGK